MIQLPKCEFAGTKHIGPTRKETMLGFEGQNVQNVRNTIDLPSVAQQTSEIEWTLRFITNNNLVNERLFVAVYVLKRSVQFIKIILESKVVIEEPMNAYIGLG